MKVKLTAKSKLPLIDGGEPRDWRLRRWLGNCKNTLGVVMDCRKNVSYCGEEWETHDEADWTVFVRWLNASLCGLRKGKKMMGIVFARVSLWWSCWINGGGDGELKWDWVSRVCFRIDGGELASESMVFVTILRICHVGLGLLLNWRLWIGFHGGLLLNLAFN